MRGVILAGGSGKRLYPLTRVTNKHLLPVYDEPMIYKVIRTLTGSGVEKITILLGGESVGDFIRLLGDGSEFGASFSYVFQQGSGGIAEALGLVRDVVGNEDLAVALGDNVFEETFSEEFSRFESDRTLDCFLFLKEVDDPRHYGVAKLDETGRKILSIEEKPEVPPSKYAVTGLYLFRSDVFRVIDHVAETVGYHPRGELEITPVNDYYVKHGRVGFKLVGGFWCDAGRFSSLLRAGQFFHELARRNSR
ncbi:MAG: sugar phosphate nucleotidyltransferase [Promethearchaeota archaeon]